jgi:hypothetical protein
VGIPESQLETWSRQGSVVQSSNTYSTVTNVLESSTSPYHLKSFVSFLQGSYGNDTNVYRDSDVDVVMRLDSTWYHDANRLPREQFDAFERAYPGTAAYSLWDFKAQVLAWLSQNFNGVKAGSKAIFIPGSGNRRDCDVVVCARFQQYSHFASPYNESSVQGICFWKGGTQIVNFPKQHSENCTAKHQATNDWFKPTVRIYKNMRNHLVEKKVLGAGVAPSYFIEGMLWNIPRDKFGTSHSTTFLETLVYLTTIDQTGFRCANGIHPLLGVGSDVSWSPADCKVFLDALVSLWTGWP